MREEETIGEKEKEKRRSKIKFTYNKKKFLSLSNYIHNSLACSLE